MTLINYSADLITTSEFKNRQCNKVLLPVAIIFLHFTLSMLSVICSIQTLFQIDTCYWDISCFIGIAQ